MNAGKSNKLLLTRLKYAWLMYVLGAVAIFSGIACHIDEGGLLLFVATFLIIEVGGVRAYQKILRGEDVYHALTRIVLSRSTGFGVLLSCMIFELVIVFVVAAITLWDGFYSCGGRLLNVTV